MAKLGAFISLASLALCAGCAVTPTPQRLRQEAAELRARNEIAAAKPRLRQAIGLQPARTAAERLAKADLWRELGSLHSSAGETAAAGDCYRQALDLLTADGAYPDAISNLRIQLAGLCHRTRRLDEAATLYRLVLADLRLRQGPEHDDTLDAMGILAGIELRLGRHANAEQLLREQLAGLARTQRGEKREAAAVLDNLAEALEATGKKAEAGEARAKAAALRHKLCEEC